MTNKEIIDSIKPFDPSCYQNMSYEKLMIYSIKFLCDNNIPLTFIYICVATFNMFPEAFYLDEEFKQHMAADRLNATFLHIKYKKKNSWLAGTKQDGFNITQFGIAMAEEVEGILKGGKIPKSVKNNSTPAIRSSQLREYNNFLLSKTFLHFKNNKLIDLNLLWEDEKVIPYTEINRIKAKLLNIQKYASNISNKEVVECINNIIRRI